MEAEGVPGLLVAPFRAVLRSVRSRPLRSVRVGVPRLFGVSGVLGVPGAPGVVGVPGSLKFPSLVNMLNPRRDFRLVSGLDDDDIISLYPRLPRFRKADLNVARRAAAGSLDSLLPAGSRCNVTTLDNTWAAP